MTAQQEREAIVKWLRKQADDAEHYGDDHVEEVYAYRSAADVIERGDHLTHQESKT